MTGLFLRRCWCLSQGSRTTSLTVSKFGAASVDGCSEAERRTSSFRSRAAPGGMRAAGFASSAPPGNTTNTTATDSTISNHDPEEQQRVVTTIDGQGIATVSLNRPDKMNALDRGMFRGLQQAALDLGQQSNKRVRVVILQGKGRAFCTGLDVPSVLKSGPFKFGAELLEKKPLATTKQQQQQQEEEEESIPDLSDLAKAVAETSNLAQDVGYLWRQLPVPVICIVHGMCYGGGLQIALGADVRFCDPAARLSIMESKWGLIPDMSITVTLRELLRIDAAKELTFTGRTVGGVEAAQLGLVTRCVPDPHREAVQLAQTLVGKSPDALRLAKQLYQRTWRTAASEQDCLQLETEYQRKLLLSWNQVAASSRNFGWKLPYYNTNSNASSKDETS